MYERLTPAECTAIETFLARLHDLLRPEQIHSVILYGSKARGDSHPFSDVDILLVADDLTRAQRECVTSISADIDIPDQIDTGLQVIVYSTQAAAEAEGYGAFLFQNIERDGIVLEGEPIHVKHIDKPKLVRQELDRAMEELKAAELMFQNEMWRATVSKTYFVYLHTARTLLGAKGVTPQSHKGVNVLFSYHLVKPKIVDQKYGTILRNMEERRIDADYELGVEFKCDDAETALARAKEFLAVAQELLPSLMGESVNR